MSELNSQSTEDPIVSLMPGYTQALKLLLPQGEYWEKAADDLTPLFDALSAELARFELFLKKIIDEADPTTAQEFLTKWERELSLTGNAGKTIEQRREDISGALFFLYTGGSLETYAKIKKYNITFHYRRYPFTLCGDEIGGYMTGLHMNNMAEVSFAGEYDNEQTENILKDLNKYKAAHLVLRKETA